MSLSPLTSSLSGWLRSFEDRLVYIGAYHRHSAAAVTPEDFGLAFEALPITTADGLKLSSWWLKADSAQWIIYFHGQGEAISRYLPTTTRLTQMGYNVLSLDYRGYGKSEGVPSESGLYSDARAAYDLLRERGVSPSDIALYGYSLGTGVATDLAANAEIGALVLEAAYTSLPDVAKHLYRIVPLGFMQNRFDSFGKIAEVEAPILFLHAPGDPLVPFEQAQALYARAPSPKTLVELPGGHSSMLDTPDSASYERVKTFLQTYLRDP